MKVFCKNCKYMLCFYGGFYFFEICRAKATIFNHLPWQEAYYPTLCLNQNRNGECKYYKRKWWKF